MVYRKNEIKHTSKINFKTNKDVYKFLMKIFTVDNLHSGIIKNVITEFNYTNFNSFVFHYNDDVSFIGRWKKGHNWDGEDHYTINFTVKKGEGYLDFSNEDFSWLQWFRLKRRLVKIITKNNGIVLNKMKDDRLEKINELLKE